MEKQHFLISYVPASALAYCTQLWEQHQFDLRIVRPRRTRLGDFTKKPHECPRITVNANLNPYSFLITYLHEVAHHVVYSVRYKKKVAPHGAEWKQAFRALLLPVLSEECFPQDVLVPLKRYSQNPKASTGSDAALVQALAKYNVAEAEPNKKTLMHLSEGVNFVFQKREFTRGPLRRTRVLCFEKNSCRRYTIPAHAQVEECKLMDTGSPVRLKVES
jgi:SprT protein